MPATRTESCSRVANTATGPSCAVFARCRDHAVALEMLGPAAGLDLPPRSPLAGRSHRALLDHDAPVGELRSPYGWSAPEDPQGSCDYEGAGASRSPSGCATRSRGCATAHAGWSSLTSASSRQSPTEIPGVPEANAGRIAVGYWSEAPAKSRSDRVGQTCSCRSPLRDTGNLSNC